MYAAAVVMRQSTCCVIQVYYCFSMPLVFMSICDIYDKIRYVRIEREGGKAGQKDKKKESSQTRQVEERSVTERDVQTCRHEVCLWTPNPKWWQQIEYGHTLIIDAQQYCCSRLPMTWPKDKIRCGLYMKLYTSSKNWY